MITKTRNNNQEMIAALSKINWRVAITKNDKDAERWKSALFTDFSSMKEFFKNRETLPWSSELENKERLTTFCGDRDAFCGGSMQDLERDLAGKIPLDRFWKAKEKFSKGKLAQRLQTLLAEISPRRKRVMSEHDGEWSYDRRFEITPFQATKKAMGMARTLELNAYVSFSSGTHSSDIDRYGAAVWALTKIVEDAGIQVRIKLICEGIRNSDKSDSFIEVLLKDFGDYVSAPQLAAAFTSNFYRRAMFCGYALASEVCNYSVTYNLGSVPMYRKIIDFQQGVLNIYPEVVDSWGSFDEKAEAALLGAIGAKGNV